MSSQNGDTSSEQLALQIKAACIQAARDGYEHAAMRGLCHEGAWEAAISAMQMLDLAALLPDEPRMPD